MVQEGYRYEVVDERQEGLKEGSVDGNWQALCAGKGVLRQSTALLRGKPVLSLLVARVRTKVALPDCLKMKIQMLF